PRLLHWISNRHRTRCGGFWKCAPCERRCRLRSRTVCEPKAHEVPSVLIFVKKELTLGPTSTAHRVWLRKSVMGSPMTLLKPPWPVKWSITCGPFYFTLLSRTFRMWWLHCPMVQLQKFAEGFMSCGFMRSGRRQFHGNKARNLRNIGSQEAPVNRFGRPEGPPLTCGE